MTSTNDPHIVNYDTRRNQVRARDLYKETLPKPSGLGIIKALEVLAGVIKHDGNEVIKFDAGLPDHDRPAAVKGELGDYAQMNKAEYSRYPRTDKAINEAKVLQDAADYHKEVLGINSPKERFVLTEGSTPAINHLIRMQAMEKAKDGRPLGEGCVLELFDLSYPLYQIPAKHVRMEVSKGIKLRTEIDVVDGQPIQSKPWQLDRATLSKSFEANRDKVAVFAFCNPANPSGYKLSHEEMDFMAEELLKDFEYRKAHHLPPKLVMEDVAYITMMHDDNDRPYTLLHALNRMVAQEEAKAQPDEARIAEIFECMETVVTVHSLSKAAAEAGDRVAYTEGSPDIIEALREVYTQDMLSYANSALHAARGAFRAGKPDRDVMRTYSQRVMAFEEGMNAAFYQVAAEKNLQLSKEQIQMAMPFPNRSSGSFFTLMNLKPLLGQQVDAATIEKVQDYIRRIDNEGIRNSFGQTFKNGIINNENDLALYFMFKTLEYGGKAVSCVPLSDGMVRFSMGMTPLEDVKQAVEAATKFFENDPAYLRALAAQQEKGPDSTVGPVYTIDRLGTAHTVAQSRAG